MRFTEGRTPPPSKQERVAKRGPAAAFGVVCFLLVRLFLVLPRLSVWSSFDCLLVCRMVSYVLRETSSHSWGGGLPRGALRPPQGGLRPPRVSEVRRA